MTKLFLKSNAKCILTECLELFPDGIPVTSDKPDRELTWWWKLNVIQKIYQTIKAWIRYRKNIWVSAESDPPFYVLNSKQLTFKQQQTLLKLMRDKYWNGVIPKYVDATDPLAHSIKILASEVSQIKTE
jgi:hypothetical protein